MKNNIIQTTGGSLYQEDIDRIYSVICDVFSCKKKDIGELKPLQKGLTNSILSFVYHGGQYVYRYPGNGSEILVDRGREAMIQEQVSNAGIDGSLVAMSIKEGWRIGRFIKNDFYDYHNLNHVVRGIKLVKKLHNVPVKIRYEFDVIDKLESIKNMIPKEKYGDNFPEYPLFSEIKERVYKLYDLTKDDGTKKCIVHGDCRDENFLINDNEIYLIDWEYSGYGDPGFDIGSYIAGGHHTIEDIENILFIYFGRTITSKERMHFYAWIAISGFFYMHWCMFKESKGQKVGDLKSLWYYYANNFSEIALKMYGGK